MRSLFIALMFLPGVIYAASTGDTADHVKVSLLAEQSAFVPGTTAWIGLRFEHQPHWHTYWINPGDSGLPTKVVWQLPAGFSAGEIVWPTPARIALGDIANFGYTGDIVFPVQISVPRDAAEGSTAHVGADVKWLVCREECVPGSASVAIDLPVHAIAINDPSATKLFDTARAAAPQAAPWTGAAYVHGDVIDVVVRGPNLPPVKQTDAFVVDRKVVANAAPKIVEHPGEISLQFKKSEYFSAAPAQLNLILKAGEGTRVRSWHVAVPFETSAPVSNNSR